MKIVNRTSIKIVKAGFFEPGVIAAVKSRCPAFLYNLPLVIAGRNDEAICPGKCIVFAMKQIASCLAMATSWNCYKRDIGSLIEKLLYFLFFSSKKEKPPNFFQTVIILFLFTFSCESYSQTFITRNGYLGFFSKTPLENIKAENRQVFAAIDAAKKNIAFTCLVKGFLFPKDLMQEHFNENYIESDKYPKASFTGSYTGDVNTSKDGTYPVQVKGQLTLHGVTKTIETPATLSVKGSTLTGASDFKITPADFDIKIPSLVREKIARQMDVHVLAECNPK